MSENSTIRCFVAAEVSSEVREELVSLTASLKASGADIKWVRPENLHITFKFLGDIGDGQVVSVSDVLSGLFREQSCFEISLGSMGVFPGWEKPRVLWVGIRAGKESLFRFAGLIEEGIGKLGFPVESRVYRAHLTIGRVKGLKNKELLRGLAERVYVRPVKSVIDKVILMKSEFTSCGVVYTPLFKVPLKQKSGNI